MTRSAKVVGTGIVTSLLLLMISVIGEASLRLVHLVRDGIPFFEETGKSKIGPIILDDTLGWRATENYGEDTAEQTFDRMSYPVHRSQNRYGFRMVGDPHSEKPKVLVIGDSYTHATQVSDGKTYFAILADMLDVEVFAYGAGGYGTLQEYMVLDRYVDLIRPDLVLWQYCTNDFINNDPLLELGSTINNNGLLRPYWLNNEIVYLLPAAHGDQIRAWINRHSRFLYLIISRLDKLRAARTAPTVEKEIEEQGFNHQGFLRSVAVTDDLMGRVRSRVGDTPIASFNCTNHEPYTAAFKTISSHHHIIFWEDVVGILGTAKARKRRAIF